MDQSTGQPPLALIICCLMIPQSGLAWGGVGHTLIAKTAMMKINPGYLSNCKTSVSDIVDHVNDPDVKWKNQRITHPHESRAHYFNARELPSKNRAALKEKNLKTGFIFERIFSWKKEAMEYRSKGNFDKLKERLVGLSHYLGDLTQPLHLHHDYDGSAVGLPDIHAQFESKMVSKYKGIIEVEMLKKLASSVNLQVWEKEDFENLVFNISDQSYLLAPRLFDAARAAYEMPQSRNKQRGKKNSKYFKNPHWIKSKLWSGTKDIAINRMSLASELIIKTFTDVCK